MPHFLTQEQYDHLRELLKTYDKVEISMRNTLRTLAGKTMLICLLGHRIVFDIHERYGRVPVLTSQKKRLKQKPRDCIYCGMPIVSEHVTERHPEYDKVKENYEQILSELERQIAKIVESHPLYSMYLKYLKFIGPISAARLIITVEHCRAILRGPSPLYRLTGYMLVSVCPKCSTVLLRTPKKDVVLLCPKCGTPMKVRVPSKKLRTQVPYNTWLNGNVSRVILLIAANARRVLNEYLEGKVNVRNLEDLGVLGTYYWWKFCHRFLKKYSELTSAKVKESDAVRQAVIDALTAARIATGQLLLQWLWHITYVLKYPEIAKVRPPETRVWLLREDQTKRFYSPLMDLPVNELLQHPLYEKLGVSRDAVAATYADFMARLEQLIDFYPRVLEKIRKAKIEEAQIPGE